MSSKVDLSLDDIIVKNKMARVIRRGRGRGPMRGSGRGGRVSRGGRGGMVGQRGRGSFRSRGASGFRSPRGGSNINGRWSHDMYYGGASAVRSISSGPTKLNITNLDFGVSDSDIKELFSEFGPMRAASVHYDRTGRSLGTAHVIFERRTDAMKAIKQYNGVHLDGRPMNIEIDGVSGGGMSRGRGGSLNTIRGSRVKRLQGGPRPIGGGGGVVTRGRGTRGRGPMRGVRSRGGRMRGGGRGGKKKVPTAEELDAELDAYSCEASKGK